MKTNTDLEETSALKLYGQIIWRRRWDFLATVTLAMFFVLIYTATRTKIYESSLLLLINSKEQTPQVVSEAEAKDNSNQGSEPGKLDTEVQVLSTLPLVSHAVDALHPSYPELDAKSGSDTEVVVR